MAEFKVWAARGEERAATSPYHAKGETLLVADFQGPKRGRKRRKKDRCPQHSKKKDRFMMVRRGGEGVSNFANRGESSIPLGEELEKKDPYLFGRRKRRNKSEGGKGGRPLELAGGGSVRIGNLGGKNPLSLERRGSWKEREKVGVGEKSKGGRGGEGLSFLSAAGKKRNSSLPSRSKKRSKGFRVRAVQHL